METQILQDIGLTESESKVYLALLELGSSTKGPIVDRSKVASSKVYELLEKLIDKGLVSYVIKSGTKYFEAATPKRLLDYMQEKERKLKTQKEKLNQLVPELIMKRSMAGIDSEVQVFKTMKGARTSFDDILHQLKEGDEYYVVGISKFTPHFENFVVHFHHKRAKQGIKCKILVNETAKDIGKKLAKTNLTQLRYVNKELFTPFVFIIYKSTVLISIGLDEIFIQIKSNNLVEGLTNYADYLWNDVSTP